VRASASLYESLSDFGSSESTGTTDLMQRVSRYRQGSEPT